MLCMYVGSRSLDVDEENSLERSLDTEEYMAGSELRFALGGRSGSGGGFS